MQHKSPPLIFGLEDIEAANSTEALADMWGEFLRARNLPDDTDADIFRHAPPALADADWTWVVAFLARWDVVEEAENFELACRIRGER